MRTNWLLSRFHLMLATKHCCYLIPQLINENIGRYSAVLLDTYVMSILGIYLTELHVFE